MEFFVERIKIDAPVCFCYKQWRDFPNLPQIFHNITSIRPINKDIWQWEMLDTFGDLKKWDLLLAEDIPNHQITWRTLQGPSLDLSANIVFESNGPTETEILITLGTVHIDDDSLTKTVSELLKVTSKTLALNLREFKAHIEQIYPGTTADSPPFPLPAQDFKPPGF